MSEKEKTTANVTELRNVLIRNIEDIDAAAEADGISGIKTGLSGFDRVTGGLQKSDLIVIAGCPSMGKTSLAHTICLNAAKNGSSVLLFSSEMEKTRVGLRLISMESGVPHDKVLRGMMTRKDWDAINDSLDVMSKTKLFIDDKVNVSASYISDVCSQFKEQEGLDLVVIDSFSLVNPWMITDKSPDICYVLKNIAREMECTVIITCQISPDVATRTDHRPMMRDFAEYPEMIDAADVILGIYREGYYHYEYEGIEPGVTELIVMRHRNGQTGTVKIAFKENTVSFEDYEPSNKRD